MPISSLLLVLTAAVLHASWNFFIKQATDRAVAAWWSLLLGALAFSPVFLIQKVEFPTAIWPYAIASGFVEAVYLTLLILAYRLADFSLVYPLARGSAPALLAIGAAVFLGERFTPMGFTGLAALLGGLLIVASGPILKRGTGVTSRKGMAVALLVAICIATYSTIDAAAVRLMDPIPYNILIIALMCLFYLPVVLFQYGPSKMISTGLKSWPTFLLVGFFTVLTYMLVLIAYSRGHVSYAGALREVSVVIGAFYGWRFLGELFGPARIVGAVVISGGILLIALAG